MKVYSVPARLKLTTVYCIFLFLGCYVFLAAMCSLHGPSENIYMRMQRCEQLRKTVEPVYIEHGCFKLGPVSNFSKIAIQVPHSRYFLHQTVSDVLLNIWNFSTPSHHNFMLFG